MAIQIPSKLSLAAENINMRRVHAHVYPQSVISFHYGHKMIETLSKNNVQHDDLFFQAILLLMSAGDGLPILVILVIVDVNIGSTHIFQKFYDYL